MHAPGVQDAVRLVVDENGVGDELASAFDLALYIQLFGNDEASFWRRLAEVYEIDRVEGGRAVGRTLFRWHADGDRFEAVEAPRTFATDRSDLEARAAILTELAHSGRTGESEVAATVEAYRSGKRG